MLKGDSARSSVRPHTRSVLPTIWPGLARYAPWRLSDRHCSSYGLYESGGGPLATWATEGLRVHFPAQAADGSSPTRRSAPARQDWTATGYLAPSSAFGTTCAILSTAQWTLQLAEPGHADSRRANARAFAAGARHYRCFARVGTRRRSLRLDTTGDPQGRCRASCAERHLACLGRGAHTPEIAASRR